MTSYSRIDTLLANLHHCDADVRIEFGEGAINHAYVHSAILADEMPRIEVLEARPDHDGVRVFAVCFQNSTCVLEPLVRPPLER